MWDNGDVVIINDIPMEALKELIASKNTVQYIWIVIFVSFMAVIRIFYSRINSPYEAVRSLMLSLWAWVLTWLLCNFLEYRIEILILCTSLMSFAWETIWDWVISLGKQFPSIFKEILFTYLSKDDNGKK